MLFWAEEDTKAKNVLHLLILEFVYTYLGTAFSQVRLHNFVVSVKCEVCAFFIRKVCSVRFFRLQNFVVSKSFVVSAFFYYKIL